ncbi:Alpha/Beta hydrolase protein [Trichoderma compactum]
MKTFNWITDFVLALSATLCTAQLDNFPAVYDDTLFKHVPQDGPPAENITAIKEYWTHSYNWNETQKRLNDHLPQSTTTIDGAGNYSHPSISFMVAALALTPCDTWPLIKPESVRALHTNLWYQVPNQQDINNFNAKNSTAEGAFLINVLTTFRVTFLGQRQVFENEPLQWAYAQTDSPVGCAAWILTEWKGGSPSYDWTLDEISSWTLW